MKQTKTLLKLVSCAVAFAVTTATFAQNKKKELNKLDLKTGQQFHTDNILKTVTSMDMMGQQMEIKMDATLVKEFVIKDKKGNSYNTSSTITKMVTTGDIMGQTTTYDSDKKEDTSETAKVLNEKINVPMEMEMNDEGKVTYVKKDTSKGKDAQGMEAMINNMGAGADESTFAEDVFHVMPKKVKAGDTWNDSSISEGIKIYRDFTVKSVEGGDATITISGKQLTNKVVETQGMEMTLVMESKLTGEMVVEIKTSVVKQRNVISDGAGTIDMMGQSVPMTTKIETTSATKSL